MEKLHVLNLFGFPISFKSNDDFKFNTPLSTLLSISIIIGTIVMSGLFGQELIKKNVPLVTSSKELISKKKTIVFLRDIPLKLYFENENFEAISNVENYFNITILDFEVTEDFEFKDPVVHINVLKKFDSSILRKEYQIIEELIAEENLYNLDFSNLFVKDSLAKPDSRSLNVQISLCDVKLEGCKDFFSEFSTLKVYMDSYEVYIDPTKYLNSVKRLYKQSLFEIGKNSLLKSRIKLKQNIVKTDIGNLFEEFAIENYVSVEKEETEFILKNKIEDKRLIELEFFSPNIVQLTLIRYIKLQELASRIGGFFNFLFILGSILTYNYNKFNFNNYVYLKFKNILKEDEFSSLKEFIQISKNNEFHFKLSENNLIQFKSNLKNESNYELNSILKSKKLNDNDIINQIDVSKSNNFQLKKIDKEVCILNFTENKNEDLNINKVSPNNFIFSFDDAKKLKIEILEEINTKIIANDEIIKLNKVICTQKSFNKLIDENKSPSTDSYAEYLFYKIFCCSNHNYFDTLIVDQILSFEYFLKQSGKNLVENIYR